MLSAYLYTREDKKNSFEFSVPSVVENQQKQRHCSVDDTLWHRSVSLSAERLFIVSDCLAKDARVPSFWLLLIVLI